MMPAFAISELKLITRAIRQEKEIKASRKLQTEYAIVYFYVVAMK